MNYEAILTELQNASTFELYRLQVAIGTLLNDPARLASIKRQLRPGMTVSYFEPQENRLVPVRVLAVRTTRASIEKLATGERWTIPLYMINVDGSDVDIRSPKKGVSRLSLKIGDVVGFDSSNGHELVGTVIKLNPKKAKIDTPAGIWTVPYPLLFTIIDGNESGELITHVPE